MAHMRVQKQRHAHHVIIFQSALEFCSLAVLHALFRNPLGIYMPLILILLCVSNTFLGTDRLCTGDLKVVLERVYDARRKWKEIGIALYIDIDDLEVIRLNSRDANSWFMDMLAQWLRRVQPLPSWDAMIKALKAPYVGYPHLAEKIEQTVYPTRVAKLTAVVQGIRFLPMVKT